MRKLVIVVLLVSGCFSANNQDASTVGDMALPVLDIAMADDLDQHDLAALPDLTMVPDLTQSDLSTPKCNGPQDCMGLAHATGKCVNGSCAIDFCDLNYGDCDGIVANGCESDNLTDPANCNFCGTSCLNVANGVGKCDNGTCAIASCNQGFANCDNMFATGCATPTANDVTNCGGCGNLCTVANASSTCANGKCGFGACNNGFADCDQNLVNGCEVSLQSDDANCNMCGTICPMNLPSCEAGVCSPDDFPPIYLLYELEEAG